MPALDAALQGSSPAFGEVAEGAVTLLLDGEDVLDLVVGEDALLDEKLTDLNAGHA